MEEGRWPSKWAELSGDGGLTSKHWRTRVAAIQSLSTLAAQSSSLDGAPLTQLLDLLIFTLALSDSHSMVRKAAVECSSQIFNGMQNQLSVTELDHFLSGFLAITVDHETDIQSAAAEALLCTSMGLGSNWFEEMVVRLVHKFVSSALHSVKLLKKTTKAAYLDTFSSSFDMSVMVPALEGIINVERLHGSGLMPESIELNISPHLISLLVAALGALLEEFEISRDYSGASKVSHLLKSLGSSKYRQHVIFMISSQSYEGAFLARLHKASSFSDDDYGELLEKVDVSMVLKGISVALDSGSAAPDSLDKDLKGALMTKVEAGALRHIIEASQIPFTLVTAVPETRDKTLEEKFVKNLYHYLKVAEAILKEMSADMKQYDIVEDYVLHCSALASVDNVMFSWITRDIQELANGIVRRLAIVYAEAQQPAQTSNVKIDAGSCVERLILRMLPELISKLKSQLRDHLSKNDDGDYGTSSNASLAKAIIAAHQLYWCLKQVHHPRLSQSCTLIMPCALMALDHYSPHVKSQAMKLFIHLTDNLNPSELRWYKDAVLDCMARNIVGCGDLWTLVVQTAIPLVLCIEGNNPRAKWYRNILNEMLGELERHHLDSARFKVWLENVDKLFEAMGLVLVAHFKRILALLFPWLHTADDAMTLLVLNTLKVIITHTWPRMPFHVEEFRKELAEVYNKSLNKKACSAIRSSVIEVAVLLQLSGGSTFDLVCQKDQSSPASLGSALVQHLSGQTA